MTTRARTALTAGVFALALVVIGAGFPATSAPPKEWASGLCTTMDTWRDVAVDSAQEMRASLSGTNTSLAEVRTKLAAYLGDVSDATATAARAVRASGYPDTPKGRKIARGMVKVFTGIHASMAKLQHRAQGISGTNPTTARRQIRSIQRAVDEVFQEFGTDFKRLKRFDSGRKLDQAFDASVTCRTLDS